MTPMNPHSFHHSRQLRFVAEMREKPVFSHLVWSGKHLMMSAAIAATAETAATQQYLSGVAEIAETPVYYSYNKRVCSSFSSRCAGGRRKRPHGRLTHPFQCLRQIVSGVGLPADSQDSPAQAYDFAKPDALAVSHAARAKSPARKTIHGLSQKQIFPRETNPRRSP